MLYGAGAQALERGQPGIRQKLSAAQGCPICVEVFDGNVADPQTLKSHILKVRARFGMERVILVGDRVMITEARLREDIMSHPDYHGQRLIVCRNPLILSTMGNFSLKTLDG